jgi:hypothetical protein
MKLSELKKYIEENITEILEAQELFAEKPNADPQNQLPNITTADTNTANNPKFKAKYNKVSEIKDEDEEVEDTYGKEDEDDKKDAKIKATEPKSSDIKKIDKEFTSTKLAKELSPDDKTKLDTIEKAIKKKLANPTKDNIEIVRQLIKKSEIKKLFKDGGKDLKALISDIIR